MKYVPRRALKKVHVGKEVVLVDLLAHPLYRLLWHAVGHTADGSGCRGLAACFRGCVVPSPLASRSRCTTNEQDRNGMRPQSLSPAIHACFRIHAQSTPFPTPSFPSFRSQPFHLLCPFQPSVLHVVPFLLSLSFFVTFRGAQSHAALNWTIIIEYSKYVFEHLIWKAINFNTRKQKLKYSLLLNREMNLLNLLAKCPCVVTGIIFDQLSMVQQQPKSRSVATQPDTLPLYVALIAIKFECSISNKIALSVPLQTNTDYHCCKKT